MDLQALKKAADDAVAAYVTALRLEMTKYQTPTPVNVPTVAPVTTTATETKPELPSVKPPTVGEIVERVRPLLTNDWQGVRGIASKLHLFHRLKDVRRACDGLVTRGTAEYQRGNGPNRQYRLKQVAPVVTNANSDSGVTAGSL